MNHLCYKFVNDYLTNSGLFDPMPDMTEQCFLFVVGDLINRLPLRIYADVLSLLHCDLSGQPIDCELLSPSLYDLQKSIELSFDILWDKIKDNPTNARETLLIDCWAIDYVYDNNHLSISLSLHLPACSFSCNSEGSYFM